MFRRFCYVGALVAAFGAYAVPALAAHDVTQFGSSIHVPKDQSVHDAVCFFCNVDADGTIEGDVVVFFGNVHIGSNANHGVVNFFGNITVDNDAAVGQDMVSFFGSVRLGENVTIGKDLVAMFGQVHAAPTVNVGGDRVVQPGWIFWTPLLIFGLVIVVIVREIRASRRRAFMRNYPNYPFPPQP